MKITIALLSAMAVFATEASPFMPYGMPDMQLVLNQIKSAAPVEQLPGMPAPVFKMTQTVLVNGSLSQIMEMVINEPKNQMKITASMKYTGQESFMSWFANEVCQFIKANVEYN